jgi:hypothetical protein
MCTHIKTILLEETRSYHIKGLGGAKAKYHKMGLGQLNFDMKANA